MYVRANAGGWDDSAYSSRGSVLELHREKCCLGHLFAQNRANLDHLLKEVTVSGKQQRGLLYINAYVSHWVSPHRHTRPGFLRVRWRVFCMHLAHVLRITDSFLAMVYLLPPVLKSARWGDGLATCIIKAKNVFISAGVFFCGCIRDYSLLGSRAGHDRL